MSMPTVLLRESPVLTLLDQVWAQSNTAFGHSFERLNHAMQAALRLAIGAGFPFARDELSRIASRYRFEYWCGNTSEWIYTLAVQVGHTQAALSYEQWQQRHPFFADEVDNTGVHDSPWRHKSTRRRRDRLAVGSRLVWHGVQVTVTSFAADGRSLTACSYGASQDNGRTTRVRIPHAALKALDAEKRARRDVYAALQQEVVAGAQDALLATLGITTRAALDALPLAVIRTAIATVQEHRERETHQAQMQGHRLSAQPAPPVTAQK